MLGDYSDIIGDRAYENIESHQSLFDWGYTTIIKDSDERYFVIQEIQPDRGSPWRNHWKIKKEYYELFKKPSVKSLEKLLSVKFFEESLFNAFIKKLRKTKALENLILTFPKSKIECNAAERWMTLEYKRINDAKEFKNPKSLGKFEVPGYIHAMEFADDNTLIVDVWPGEEGWDASDRLRCTIDIKKKALIAEEAISADIQIPFFVFGKDYPIKPIKFGDGYSANVTGQNKTSGNMKVNIKKGKETLYMYEYPSIAGLGRFFTFPNKNSVLFMYSMRDNTSSDEYYILKFDAKHDKVIPSTRVVCNDDSTVALSEGMRMAFILREPNSGRAMKLQVVQL